MLFLIQMPEQAIRAKRIAWMRREDDCPRLYELKHTFPLETLDSAFIIWLLKIFVVTHLLCRSTYTWLCPRSFASWLGNRG